MRDIHPTKLLPNPSLKKMISEAKKVFGERFKNLKNIKFSFSPASIMILGDHTHYNDGIILMTTIDAYAIAIASASHDNQINLVVDSPDFSVSENTEPNNESFIKCGNLYLGNLISLLKNKGYIKAGFNLLLYSNIPQSVGMGFVAANQFALVDSINKLFGLDLTPDTISDLCIEAESIYLGKMSNPAHYFAIRYCQANSIIKVDLRFRTYSLFNVLLKDYFIVVFDNSIEIPNPKEICNERIKECSIGVQALRLYIWGIKNLRDVSIDFLARHAHVIPNIIYKRVLYTVKEKVRVETGIEFLKNNYVKGLAKLMLESHNGLRSDYEIGNGRHDFILSELSKNDAVLGSKIISCSNIESVISIIQKKPIRQIALEAAERYKENYHSDLNFHVYSTVDGIANLTI